MLTELSALAGVPAHDVIGILRKFGRDIAGALQIWDPDEPGEPRQPSAEPLTDSQVATMLSEVNRYPLGNKLQGGKTSLAGVQDKIVLAYFDDTWHRAVDGFASTHILKPETRDHPSVIYDEEYGARIAQALGLADHKTWIEKFARVPALIIERYDRSVTSPGGRIHQEDFSQVLAIAGNEKYQRYGGKATLRRISDSLAILCGQNSIEAFLRLNALAIAVGNLDMHTKNISILHPLDAAPRLAPAYDVVPQAHQPTDGELALAVNGIYAHAQVTAEDLIVEGTAWGIPQSEAIVIEVLTAVETFVSKESPHNGAYAHLTTDIAHFCQQLLAGDPAGNPISGGLKAAR